MTAATSPACSSSAGARRRQGLQAAQAREQEARQAARARRRLLSRNHRRRHHGNGRHPLRRRRHGDHHHRHARLRPGPRRAFAQVLTEKLGVPFDRIRLVQGDSDQLVTGGGTGGSRSAMLSGTAIVAGLRQGDRARQADRRACAGSVRRRYRIRATAASSSPAPTASIGIMELAEKLRGGLKLPDGVPASLDVTHVTDAGARHFPERLPCRRGRDRSGHRRDARW